ncbi:MAG: winged helix-turn-helix transcriptional regulator [Planctomycetes bacterium]|nr:winged helix-turn-helix transcriptional regulator [Planctomycetota bacterium]
MERRIHENLELLGKGPALEQFLLKKRGLHWDGVPEPGFGVKDCQESALSELVQRGQESGRLDDSVNAKDRQVLLENLVLRSGKFLKRAAALLFAEEPERFVGGAYLKLGFFINDADLRYQDEVRGPLIHQVDRAMDLLTSKYLKAFISYEGIQRVERFVVPREALREALLNAVVHKDYASGIPIQIKVYDNQLIIWNSGHLPEGWTAKDLLTAHPSKPFNPLIASAFFRAGMIESWGRGIEKISAACLKAGIPAPIFQTDLGGLMLTFPEPKWLREVAPEASSVSKVEGQSSGVTTQETTRETTREKLMNLLRSNPKTTRVELAKSVGLTEDGVKYHLKRLRDEGFIRHVGPTKTGHWEVLQ